MSKRKTPKKKNPNAKYIPKKKDINKKKIAVISIIIGAVVIVCAAVAIIYGVLTSAKTQRFEKLCEYDWYPVSAKNASNDEVELQDVYNVNYENFEGVLSFFDDSTFTFWMSKGDPGDGTHSGKFEYNEENTVDIYFDDGTYTTFTVDYEGSDIHNLIVKYDEYTITFSQHPLA